MMVYRDSLKGVVQLKPEDVKGTALFLNGNLIQSAECPSGVTGTGNR
jgi:hypothetical protein